MGRKQEAAPPPPPPAPAFSPSEIRYGDQVIGKTYQDPTTGAIVNQYLPDPAETERKRLLQEKINAITSTLGRTAPELASQYNQTEQAFVADAKNKFLQEYDPALADLRENVASRFGTLNNSAFFNNLNKLEQNRTSALSDIVTRGKLLKNNLADQEEAKKLSELQAVGGLLSNDQSSFLNNIQPSMNSSNAMNDFLNSQWISQLRDFRNTQESTKNNSYLSNMLAMFKKPFGK